MPSFVESGRAKTLVFVACLLPLLWVIGRVASGAAGPDPAEALVLATGIWALRFLLLTLAVSPLRSLLNVPWVMRYRRMLGLYCFFYACVHLLCVATYVLGWNLEILVEELQERPYMVMGFTAWLLLIPLAVTSNAAMIRRLGRRWRRLHKLVYPAAVVAVAHFVWLVRSDFGEALLYAVCLGALFAWRIYARGIGRRTA